MNSCALCWFPWAWRRKRIVALYGGVDAERFRPDLDGSPIRARYGLEGKRVLLSVGRLVERKGVDTVFKALPTVLERCPEARYLVVGEGPYRAFLERLAADLDLGGKVVFAGHVAQDDLPLVYAAADVFVMASRVIEANAEVEGFGLVFLEANACGKPVVGGRSGGVVDAVANGETGLLADPLNPEDVARALSALLCDPAYARRLGENGRRRVEREFRWPVLAAKVAERL